MLVVCPRIAACLALLASVAAREARAQDSLALAPAGPVAVTRDVSYGRADGAELRMDVYRPERPGAGRLPVLVFFNQAVGARERSFFWYVSWARAAASRGMVAVVPDLRDGGQASDFDALLAHLRARAGDYGLDPEAIAVYAASGNSWTALPILEKPGVPVRAVIIYYGAGNVAQLRPELPLLVVRAGLDRPSLNHELDALVGRALAQNVPVTVINHPGGHHAFEGRDPDDATRDAMERTIAFAKSATAPGLQAAVRAAMPEAVAAAHILTGDFARAAATYQDLLVSRPDDATLRLSYGEALLGAGQFATACSELAKLRDRGLGPRDLGIPAARACAQAGEGHQAVEWLRSIPPRFRPRDLRDDPALSALRGRRDFEALFTSG